MFHYQTHRTCIVIDKHCDFGACRYLVSGFVIVVVSGIDMQSIDCLIRVGGCGIVVYGNRALFCARCGRWCRRRCRFTSASRIVQNDSGIAVKVEVESVGAVLAAFAGIYGNALNHTAACCIGCDLQTG